MSVVSFRLLFPLREEVFSDPVEEVENVADEPELDVAAVDMFGSAGMKADGALEVDVDDETGFRLFRCIFPRMEGSVDEKVMAGTVGIVDSDKVRVDEPVSVDDVSAGISIDRVVTVDDSEDVRVGAIAVIVETSADVKVDEIVGVNESADVDELLSNVEDSAVDEKAPGEASLKVISSFKDIIFRKLVTP